MPLVTSRFLALPQRIPCPRFRDNVRDGISNGAITRTILEVVDCKIEDRLIVCEYADCHRGRQIAELPVGKKVFVVMLRANSVVKEDQVHWQEYSSHHVNYDG